jgi:nucleoid-associated protein YgaU
MSPSSLRVALAFWIPLAFLSLAHGQAPAPGAPATPAATAPAVEPQDTAEAKLAVVLRSYSLLEAENDQLKAAQEKLAAEKASLEAQLAVARNALPLADQAAALHEQLRQTQNQLAALSLENNQLKTLLATSPSAPGTPSPTSLQPSVVTVAPAPDPLPAAAPAPRTHVVVEGDTLTKISRQYYGTTGRWAEILAANHDALRDEKSLVVGSKLRIP